MPSRDTDVPADGHAGDVDDAPRSPTIYDVAKHAGVAPSTVSRALARPGRVGAATAQKVRDAAKAIGYRSAPVVWEGTPSRTSILALSVSDVTNPFYAEIIRGAQSAAAQVDFTMMLVDGQESDILEREALGRALPAVEGIVMASSRMTDAAIRMTARQKPTVVLNRNLSDVSCIVTDNATGVTRSVELLASLGHRSITYVAGPEASWADGNRWRGVLAATEARGLSARRIGHFAPTVSGGAQAGDQLLAHPPTAVVAYNDQVAIGIINTLVTHGISVPQQVSVVGFDDIFASRLVTPPLTTVAAPLRQMGEMAVRNLIAVIGGARPQSGEPLVVPTRLLERGSTGPVRTP